MKQTSRGKIRRLRTKAKNLSKQSPHKSKFKETQWYRYWYPECKKEVGRWGQIWCKSTQRHSWLLRCSIVQIVGCLSAKRYTCLKPKHKIWWHHRPRQSKSTHHGSSHPPTQISSILRRVNRSMEGYLTLWTSRNRKSKQNHLYRQC